MLQKELKTTPSDLTMANGGDYGTSSLAFWLGIHRRRRFISEYAERAFFSFAPKQVLMFPVIYFFLIFHASANISRNLIVNSSCFREPKSTLKLSHQEAFQRVSRHRFYEGNFLCKYLPSNVITVHVGYSVHGYSGQPVIVAIWPGTEFLHSKRLPPVIVAAGYSCIFGWSQGGHYNRRVLYLFNLSDK